MTDDLAKLQISEQIREIQPWLLRLEHMFEAHDPVVVEEVRRIISGTAHILDALGTGWDPVLGFAVLAFCGEKASAKSATWDAYTQDVAPIVNRRKAHETLVCSNHQASDCSCGRDKKSHPEGDEDDSVCAGPGHGKSYSI